MSRGAATVPDNCKCHLETMVPIFDQSWRLETGDPALHYQSHVSIMRPRQYNIVSMRHLLRLDYLDIYSLLHNTRQSYFHLLTTFTSEPGTWAFFFVKILKVY